MTTDTHKKELFEHLFKAYYRQLYHFALSRVGSNETAADMVNDVFCLLWERFDSIDTEAPLLPLLFTLTRNRCADHLRSTALMREKSVDISEMQLHDDNINDILEREAKINTIMKRIEQLPPQTRKVVNLCFLKNLKYKETAQQLDISVNTVKTLIRRALKSLRETGINDN